MSILIELIQEYCLDGVVYKTIDELFNTRNGYTPSKSNSEFWENGTVPWFRMEDIRENGPILYDAIQHISPKAVKGALFPEDSIIVATSATIGEHALLRVKSLANQRFTYLMLKDEWKPFFDIKFIFYYCYKLDRWCLSHLNQGNFASVDMKQFHGFKFPVPPLEVQREIVRILDNFTELTEKLAAELAAELAARKKQYEHYRDELLAFGDDVPRVTLPEISENCDSQRKPVTKGKREAGEYPYYGASGIVDYVADYLFDGDYLLISEDGANLTARVTPIAFSISGKNWVNNHAHVLKFEDEKVRKFVEFCLNGMDLSPYISGGAQPKLNQANLNRIHIPFPAQENIAEIVSVLESFEALYTSISSELPAEIEDRQKQYEYYRDKLLTFKELAVE